MFFFVLLASSAATFAAYLVNHPVEVRQPDGSVLNLFATGDEFYHRIHDAEGYTLIRDAQGYVSYAVLQADKLVSSGVRYGAPRPTDGRIVPNIDISGSARQARRDAFFKAIPARPAKPSLRQSGGKTSFSTYKPEGPYNSIGDNTGTINNLAIYITFSEGTAFTASQSTFNDYFNKTGTDVTSVKNYFNAASYNGVNFNTAFYPAQPGSAITVTYQDTYSRNYYMPYDASSNPIGYDMDDDDERAAREHGLLKRAAAFAESSIPAGLNIDLNNDGLVDNVSFVTQGGVGPWSSILWAHRWVLYSETATIRGKQVWDYMLVPETSMYPSTLCHEMGHVLGAPDFYVYGSSAGDVVPVGDWEIMAWQTYPTQSASAHVRNKYWLWIADDEIPEITQSGTYTLNESWVKPNPAASTYNAFKITSPASTTGEFFLIEYRNKNTYWDSALPGEGIVIYRITPSVEGNSGGAPYEEYIYRANNSATDLSAAAFSSTSGRTTFSDSSNPPALLQNGSGGLGGISISNIGAAGGSTMSFTVNFPAPVAPVATAATNVNYASFTANWNVVPPALNYKLSVYYKNGADKIYVLNDFEVGKTTSYTVDDLDRELSTTYYYTVKSVVGGSTSTESNEITVPLGSTLLPVCSDYTNVLPGENLVLYYWGSSGENGPFLGQNNWGDSQFAEYFNLNSSGTINSVTINAAIVQNTSGSGKITVKVWSESGGLPSAVLAQKDVPLSSLSIGANTINFNSPVTVSGKFFVGYEVYYGANDVFSAPHTFRSAGESTTYAYESDGVWRKFSYSISMGISVNACPSSTIYAGFTADATTGCDNLTVQFTNASQSMTTITSYLWDFGDGNTSTAQNPSHTYGAVGKYTVALTVSTAAGSKTKTAVDYIIVGTAPQVSYVVTEATSSNNGEIDLTITGSTNYTVEWDDDATITSEDRTGLAPGTYKVTVTDNESGCSSGEISIVVDASNGITAAMITITGGPYVYTGSQIMPTYTVKDGATDLVLNTDYEFVSYGANINAGEGTLTLKGMGTYSTAEVTKTFPIGKAQIAGTITTPITKVYDRTNGAAIAFDNTTGIITGDAADVTITIVAEYDDENVGTGKDITITEISLAGDKSGNYDAPDPAGYTLTGDITEASYTYDPNITPQPKVIIVGSTLADINAAEKGEGVVLDGDAEEVDGDISWFTDNALTTPATNAVFDAVTPSLPLYWSFTTTDTNYDPTAKTGSATFNVQAGAFQTLAFALTESTIEKTYGDVPFTNAASNSSTNGGAITYEVDDTNVATVDAAGEVTILAVGTAVITAKAAMVPALYAETTISYNLEVVAKDIDGATVTVTPTYTYNGSAQTPAETDVTVVVDNVTLDPATDYTVAASDNTNAGTATVTVTGAGNYTGTATGSFAIGKQSISIDAAGSTVAPKTYDNTTSADLSVAFTGVAAGETLALNADYTISDAAFNSPNVAAATTVTATIALVANGPVSKNYELAAGAFTKAATIGKANAAGVTQTVMVKSALAHSYDFDLATLLPSVIGTLGNETYAPAITNNTAGVLGTLSYTSGTTLALPVLSVTGGGNTAEVTVTISSDNYNPITSIINVETTDKIPLAISGITMNGGVYNGLPYAYTGEPQLADASDPTNDIDDEVELDVLYASTDGAGYSSGDAPVDAGDYSLTLSVPTANVDYTGSISFNFSIARRPIQVIAEDASAVQETSIPTSFAFRIGNIVPGETALNPTPEPILSSPSANIQVIGGYPIIVDLNGATPTANYVFDTPSTVNGTLSVVSATTPVTGVSLSQTQATIYEGYTMTLTATVLPATATNRTVTWSSSNPAVADVINGVVSAFSPGTATITVRTVEGNFTAACAVTVIASTPPLSSDASLYNLTVSSGTLNPEFLPYIFDYAVEVPNRVTGILITATANHYGAYVSGDGQKTLQVGANTFVITVTAEDGSTLNYTVVVRRDVGTSTDKASSEQPTIAFDEAFSVMQIRSGAVVRNAQVFDLAGMLQIEVRPNASGTIYIPIAHLSSAAYIVRIETVTGVTTTRFVKRK